MAATAGPASAPRSRIASPSTNSCVGRGGTTVRSWLRFGYTNSNGRSIQRRPTLTGPTGAPSSPRSGVDGCRRQALERVLVRAGACFDARRLPRAVLRIAVPLAMAPRLLRVGPILGGVLDAGVAVRHGANSGAAGGRDRRDPVAMEGVAALQRHRPVHATGDDRCVRLRNVSHGPAAQFWSDAAFRYAHRIHV